MKVKIYVFLTLILLGSFKIGECEMDAKTLIQLLNFSENLIQDGELKFLLYQNFFTHSNDVGIEHRKMLANWERQLRENPPKSDDPEGTRKEILGYMEREKRYGEFRDAPEKFTFLEANLVFQILHSKKEPWSMHAYRLEEIFSYDNYPSLGHLRFYNGGKQKYFLSNSSKILMGQFPNQYVNVRRYKGYLARWEKRVLQNVFNITFLPPSSPIDETQAELLISRTNTGKVVYVITHFPYEKVKVKVHVHLKDGVPEVFREEFYYQSTSTRADAEEYWLRMVKIYRDFEWVSALNISFPKVREEQEFRSTDGFMRRHAVYMIKEMDFNLGLPVNFFDWNEAELNSDDGGRKPIRGDIPNEKTGTIQTAATR